MCCLGQRDNMPAEYDDTAFWEEFLSLLIQMGCLIERKKLGREITTADLRKAGKRALCNKVDKD